MNVDDASPEPYFSEFVEVDPTGRYGRYNEILGKGSSKTVYKAFDEYEGIEVAWNQVKLHDFLQSPDDLERLYCEIHLLKTLKHENIMKFYVSWVDSANRNINFVTEMFTSGTLRQYRLKHRRVNIRALKHWCKQILRGLVYLHSRDPPVIHRDLKCDNIFVNGNQGEVKIGDLGLAAILRKSHAARCVGTPEFMAPEVYEEEYNELVDIYAFGMCVLEMVTFEYPYSECSHPAQIYKKVISGKKPESLYKVKDPEVREFVEKCLATVSLRFSASELLEDPFLQTDDCYADSKAIEHSDYSDGALILKQPVYGFNYSNCSSLINSYSNYPGYDLENGIDYHELDFDASEIGLFTSQDDEDLEGGDIAIKGRRRDDDGIFLRLRIADKEGRIRNIYFPFDIETDTALSVAAEMVSELDITDQDVTKIADMIDGEIATLVPDWKTKLGESDASFSHYLPSNGYLSDHVSSNNDGAKNFQVLNSSNQGLYGRFEEVTYKVKGTEECDTEVAEADIHYADIWAQRDSMDVNFDDQAHNESPQLIHGDKETTLKVQSRRKFRVRRSFSVNYVPDPDFVDDYENEIRKELRWLKAKYQMQLREHTDHNKAMPLRATEKSKHVVLIPLPSGNKLLEKKSFHFTNQGVENSESSNVLSSDFSPEGAFNAKSFCASELPPHHLHRAASLPFDALDV